MTSRIVNEDTPNPLGGPGVLGLTAVLEWTSIRPSNERDWSPDQVVLPRAEINGDMVRIHNIRNFEYESEGRYTPGYHDKTFDLKKLDSVWFIVERC